MSSTGGRLGFITVVHWEEMHWFVRGIDASDIDAVADTTGFIDTELYIVDVGGVGFLFFEFKHETAVYNSHSGQIKALERFATSRLIEADRFIWVRHNASPAAGVAHVHPRHIISWKAFVGGRRYRCVGKGDEAESLEEFVGEWQHQRTAFQC